MSIISKFGKVLVKNSPKICIAIGFVGIGVGTYIACKSSLEHIDDLEEIKLDLDVKDYIPASKRFAKVYWPSFVVIGGSIFVIVCGHKILSKRYAAMVVAYEGLSRTYKDYRRYIIGNYGKDVDFSARHYETGVTMTDSEVHINDDIFIPDRDLSDFAVFFGRDYSANIETDDPEEAFAVAKGVEDDANGIFEAQGYLFLQDVYEMLGLDRYAPDGVGWAKGIGDDFIDFGIFSIKNGHAVNGDEPVFLLDFNHDGYILPYI